MHSAILAVKKKNELKIEFKIILNIEAFLKLDFQLQKTAYMIFRKHLAQFIIGFVIFIFELCIKQQYWDET